MRFSHLQSRCQGGYIQVLHTQFFLSSNIMCEEEEEDPGLDFRVAYSLHSSEVKDIIRSHLMTSLYYSELLRFPKTITSAAALPVWSEEPSAMKGGKRYPPTKHWDASWRWRARPSWQHWWGYWWQECEKDQPSWRNRLPSTCDGWAVLHRRPVSSPASPAAPSRLLRWRVSLARFARKRIQTQSSPHKDCSSEIPLLAIG